MVASAEVLSKLLLFGVGVTVALAACSDDTQVNPAPSIDGGADAVSTSDATSGPAAVIDPLLEPLRASSGVPGIAGRAGRAGIAGRASVASRASVARSALIAARASGPSSAGGARRSGNGSGWSGRGIVASA